MTVYLNADQVADRLGVARRTAMAMMMEMNPIAISGTVKKRYRVTEESLERWMARKTIGKPHTGSISKGSNKRLARR